VHWLVGWLVGWVVHQSVGCSVSQLQWQGMDWGRPWHFCYVLRSCMKMHHGKVFKEHLW